MGDQIVSCPGCGVKLKLKDDRVLPADAECPKCKSPLFRKSKPVSGPTSPSSSKSVPAPARPAKPVSRRPSRDEYDEFDEIEEDFEEEDEPRFRSRKKSRSSSGGIPGWAIGALIGVVAVGIVVGIILMIPQGTAGPVAQQPPAAANPGAGTTPDAVTLPASGNTNTLSSQAAVIPAGQSTGPATGAQSAAAPVAPTTLPSAAAAGGGRVVKYQPKPDSMHYYNFEVVSDFDKYQEKSTGTCMLTARKLATSGFSVKKESQEGSGTGFVVGSNGVIVTCAHVVDGTESIQVVIGGQTYPATVLHSDSALDLAVIKIEANGLPVVPLANSDQIQLGQSLRVIGFPLSDVLGTGIKITQGSISGIVEKDGQRQIQTDATINPGNSGGPVFNTRGEVVGIASAKLSGRAVSQVGFCVPSNALSGMLQQKGIVLAPPIPGQEMDTPTMVQKVSPSVTFIKVKMGPDDQAQLSFSYSATMHTHQDARALLARGPSISLPISEMGDLSMTESGVPVEVSDGNYAPIVMSRLPLLPFIELSKSGQTDWTNQRDISIIREERDNSPSGRFRSRFGRFDSDLFPNQKPKVVAVQKAVERDQFHVTSNTDQQLVLSRTYELRTTDGTEPAIVLTGTGSWTLDRGEGMPTASDLKGTYKVTVSGVTVTIPYTVSVTRWTEEQMKALKDRVAATQAERAIDEERQKNGEPPVGSNATHSITAKSWGYKTLTISPNGKTAAFTEHDKAVFVYDLATGKEIDSKAGLDNLGTPSASAYSPDGKYLLIGGDEGIIRVWSVDEKGKLDTVGDFVGHSDDIESIEVAPDSKTVISADQKKRVRVWSLDDQKEKYAIANLNDETVEIGITADGKNGMLVATNSVVTTFNLTDGKVTSTQPAFKSHYGQVALISPDGKTLFIPDSYNVTCHTLKGKNAVKQIDLGETLWCLAYSANTEEVLAGGNGKIHICDWKKQTRTAVLSTGNAITGYVKNVAISPDGRYVAAICGPIGQSILIFDRQAGKTAPADEKAPDKKGEDANPFE